MSSDQERLKYVSLQEATRFCNYSQEYLSLRARTGKLKAIKFGRNWVTKKEWLDDYLEEVKGYHQEIKREAPAQISKTAPPPKNLPAKKLISPQARLVFASAAVYCLLVAGATLNQAAFQNVFIRLDPAVKMLSHDLASNLTIEIPSGIPEKIEVSGIFKNYTLDKMAGSFSVVFNNLNKVDITVDKEVQNLAQLAQGQEIIKETYHQTGDYVGYAKEGLAEVIKVVKQSGRFLEAKAAAAIIYIFYHL